MLGYLNSDFQFSVVTPKPKQLLIKKHFKFVFYSMNTYF